MASTSSNVLTKFSKMFSATPATLIKLSDSEIEEMNRLYGDKDGFNYTLDFLCDYDKKIKKWIFVNINTNTIYKVDDYFNPEEFSLHDIELTLNLAKCYIPTKNLIKRQLKNAYPNYEFGEIKVNNNSRYYDEHTKSWVPPYKYTILIYYKKK